MKTRILTFLPVAVALMGCSTVGEKGNVSREWATGMRELGIHPLYPPKEDVYVGDVYLSPATDNPNERLRDADGFTPIGILLARMNVTSALQNHYTGRPSFATAINPMPASVVETKGTLFDEARASERLRQVAFPFFLKATVSKAQLGAFLPNNLLNRELDLNSASINSATVSVDAAESYGVPLLNITKQVTDLLGIDQNSQNINSSNVALLKAAVPNSTNAETQYANITVITEVFYARAFNVTFHRAQNTKFSLFGQKEAAASATAPERAASAVQAAASAVGAAASAPRDARSYGAEAEQRADSFGRSYTTLSVPGASAAFNFSKTGDIGLTQAFPRPIAIGYRGFRLRVNLADGKFSGAPISGLEANFNSEGTTGDLLNVPTKQTAEPNGAVGR